MTCGSWPDLRPAHTPKPELPPGKSPSKDYRYYKPKGLLGATLNNLSSPNLANV